MVIGSGFPLGIKRQVFKLGAEDSAAPLLAQSGLANEHKDQALEVSTASAAMDVPPAPTGG